MTTGGYIQNYGTNPHGPIERAPVLLALSASAAIWLLATLFAGALSDRIGRKNTYIIGWICQLGTVFVLFPLVNTGNIWLLFLGLALQRVHVWPAGGVFLRSCSPRRSDSPVSRFRTLSVPSSAARSRRRSRPLSCRQPARPHRLRSISRS